MIYFAQGKGKMTTFRLRAMPNRFLPGLFFSRPPIYRGGNCLL
jgi:hypothetical protein